MRVNTRRIIFRYIFNLTACHGSTDVLISLQLMDNGCALAFTGCAAGLLHAMCIRTKLTALRQQPSTVGNDADPSSLG